MNDRRFGIWWSVSIAALAGAVFVLAPHTSSTFEQHNVLEPPPAITAAPRHATMLFTGDIMLSRAVGDEMVRQGDWTWPFRRIASVTAGADLTFGNLETPVSDRGALAGCGYCFRTDPHAVRGLVFAGFDVLSVANNHAWDYGPVAFSDTLAHLADAGIEAVGGGADERSAHMPVYRDVNGTRVALLAYTDLLHPGAAPGPDAPGVNLYDAERTAADIADAAERADVVIVSFHTGEEYEPEPSVRQRRMFEAAIDAGADLVIGHHPHVVQPLERYKDGWIAYSLGNFVFDQTFSDETMTGLVLRADLSNGALAEVSGIPVRISRQYQPVLPEEMK